MRRILLMGCMNGSIRLFGGRRLLGKEVSRVLLRFELCGEGERLISIRFVVRSWLCDPLTGWPVLHSPKTGRESLPSILETQN